MAEIVNPNPIILPNEQPERVGGRLTRAGMETVIRRGESVMVHDEKGSRIVTRIDDLPSAAAMARGNAQLIEQARRDAQARRASLEADEKLLADLEKNAAEGEVVNAPTDEDKAAAEAARKAEDKNRRR